MSILHLNHFIVLTSYTEFLELPGSEHSELHAQYSGVGKQATSVAWLTGQGIYHGIINYGTPSSASDALIDSAQLLPYPPPSYVSPDGTTNALPEIPTSVGVTKFHFISLFGDRLAAVSSLDSRMDFEEAIPLVCFIQIPFLA